MPLLVIEPKSFSNSDLKNVRLAIAGMFLQRERERERGKFWGIRAYFLRARTHNFGRQMLVSIFVFIYCLGASIFGCGFFWLVLEFFEGQNFRKKIQSQDVPVDNRLVLIFGVYSSMPYDCNRKLWFMTYAARKDRPISPKVNENCESIKLWAQGELASSLAG